ncbi:MAG: hypothetical protein ACRDT6_04095 [Micromonosporaceae bacterium]
MIQIARAVTTSSVSEAPSGALKVIVPACRSTVVESTGGPPIDGRTWYVWVRWLPMIELSPFHSVFADSRNLHTTVGSGSTPAHDRRSVASPLPQLMA